MPRGRRFRGSPPMKSARCSSSSSGCAADPTPATVENEYREEHYRRIGYANESFSNNRVPGWKTDRGMIYIKYGPPDERDEHRTGGVYQRPVEEGGGQTTRSRLRGALPLYRGSGEGRQHRVCRYHDDRRVSHDMDPAERTLCFTCPTRVSRCRSNWAWPRRTIGLRAPMERGLALERCRCPLRWINSHAWSNLQIFRRPSPPCPSWCHPKAPSSKTSSSGNPSRCAGCPA